MLLLYYCVSFLVILFTNAFAIANVETLPDCHISNTYQKDFTFNCKALQNGINHAEYLEEHLDKFVCNGTHHRYADFKSSENTYRASTIRLDGCSIPQITHKFLQRISLIHSVYLDNSDIETIESVTISNDLNMKVLSMTHNSFRELPISMLAYAPQLEEIYFSNNQIELVKFGGFGKKFTVVDLSYNRIENLDKDAFVDLTELVTLDLSYNLIKYFPADLSNTRSHRDHYLYLQSNRIEQVNCNTFAKQSVVLLSGNPIKNIDLNCTENDLGKLYVGDLLEELTLPPSPLVDNLTEIHAASNKIKKISIERDMRNLKVLSLYNNSLTNVSDILQYCNNLEELNLSENTIGDLSSDRVVKMTNLKQLFLRDTMLTKFEPEMFSHLTRLTDLDLSNNKLKTFDFSSVVFEHLFHLFLGNNSLTELPNWSAAKFPSLKWLDISNNNFNCSYLDQFMKETPERIELQPETTVVLLSTGKRNINGINCIDRK